MATSRADRVATKLQAGRLPRETYTRLVGDFGIARVCDGCDEPAEGGDFSVLVEYRHHSPLQFHRECFLAWLAGIEPTP